MALGKLVVVGGRGGGFLTVWYVGLLMKVVHIPAKSPPDEGRRVECRILPADLELTPETAAVAANLLSRGEQLEGFEKDLEAHDGGNQPA